MDFSTISHKRNSFGIDKMPTLPKKSQRSKDMYVNFPIIKVKLVSEIQMKLSKVSNYFKKLKKEVECMYGIFHISSVH